MSEITDKNSNYKSGARQFMEVPKIGSSFSTYASLPLRLFRPHASQRPEVVGFPVSGSPFLLHTKTMSHKSQDQIRNQ